MLAKGALTDTVCATGKRPHRIAAVKQLEAIAQTISNQTKQRVIGSQLVYRYEDVNPSPETNENAPKRMYFRSSPVEDRNKKFYEIPAITPDKIDGAYEHDDVQVTILSPIEVPEETAAYIQTELKQCERDIIHPFRSFQAVSVDDFGLPKEEVIKQFFQHHAFYKKERYSGGLDALLFIDLDKFKRINDDYGHRVGDAYIRAMFRAIRHVTAPLGANAAVARKQGDEYAIGLVSTTLEATQHLTSRLNTILESPEEFEQFFTEQRRMERRRTPNYHGTIPPVRIALKATVGVEPFSMTHWDPSTFTEHYESRLDTADSDMRLRKDHSTR